MLRSQSRMKKSWIRTKKIRPTLSEKKWSLHCLKSWIHTVLKKKSDPDIRLSFQTVQIQPFTQYGSDFLLKHRVKRKSSLHCLKRSRIRTV